MDKLLFKNVICKGYLKKQNTKYVYYSNIDDEYIEDENTITLNQGGECVQNICKFVEKEFEGICVGILSKSIRRKYIDFVNDGDYGREEQCVVTRLEKPIQVAKVYYGNNKSRLVPIDKIKMWKSPF